MQQGCIPNCNALDHSVLDHSIAKKMAGGSGEK